MYDWEILHLLPDIYMPGVSFGIHFNLYKYILGWGSYLFLLILLFTRRKRDIVFLSINCLFYLNFMPVSSSFGINDVNWFYILGYLLYWGMLFVCGTFWTDIKLNMKRIKISNSRMIYNCSFFIVFFLAFMFVYKYNGLKISFNFNDIYDLRESMAGNLPIWFSWIKNAFGNLCIPVMIVWSLSGKKYIYTIILTFFQIILFSVGMDKIYILSLIISLFVGIFLLNKVEKIYTLIPLFILIVLVLAYLENYFFESTGIFYIVVRRTFYIPAWMNTLFFNFFFDNDKILFTQDVFLLSKILPDIYTQSVNSMINYTFFHGKMASPNTGMFATAFMHLGFGGALFFPFLMTFFLKFIDSIMDNTTLEIKFIFSICISILLTNLSIIHGFFLSIIIVAIPFCCLINKMNKNVDRR